MGVTAPDRCILGNVVLRRDIRSDLLRALRPDHHKRLNTWNTCSLKGGDPHCFLVLLQMCVEDLENLLDVWNVTGLKLRPDRNIVQRDLEGSCRQEVSLHHVAEEERHQTGEHLVILTPDPEPRGVEPEEQKRVLTAEDQQQGDQLQVRDQGPYTAVEGGGGVVLSLDGDVGVDLADGPGVILEHLTVPSGGTVLEPEVGPGEDLCGDPRVRVRLRV